MFAKILHNHLFISVRSIGWKFVEITSDAQFRSFENLCWADFECARVSLTLRSWRFEFSLLFFVFSSHQKSGHFTFYNTFRPLHTLLTCKSLLTTKRCSCHKKQTGRHELEYKLILTKTKQRTKRNHGARSRAPCRWTWTKCRASNQRARVVSRQFANAIVQVESPDWRMFSPVRSFSSPKA